MKSALTLILSALVLTFVQPSLADEVPHAEDAVSLTVHKDPNCGCCGKWMTHMSDAGFSIEASHPDAFVELKDALGVPPRLRSCHTAVTEDGFVFEGHIPARYVEAFLAAPPEGAAGLIVPGMPVGSPGMEVGNRFMPYDVLLLNRDGSTAVFAHVATASQQFEDGEG